MRGRLCRWLKLLGYDTEYYRGGSGRELIYRSLKSRRIIITRRENIDKNTGYKLFIVDTENSREKLKRVVNNFNLSIDKSKIYTRCIECNQKLESVNKDSIEGVVPRHIYRVHNNFLRCTECEKIFWRGTHRNLIEKELKQLKNENNGN